MASASDVYLMPGEAVSHRAEFAVESLLVSTFFPHLKSTLTVTDCRVIVRHPQIVFGVFPAGYIETFCALADVSEVSSGVSVNSRRFNVGVLSIIAAVFALLTVFASGPFAFLFFLVFAAVGVFLVASAYTPGLSVRNSGGGLMAVTTAKRNRDAVEASREAIALLIFESVDD